MCDKRPASPGCCHPITKHPKFEHNKNDIQKNMNGFNLLDDVQLKEVRIRLKDVKYLSTNASNDLSHNNVYEVETVLGKKIENGKSFYFIKWKNWSSQYNTWEPLENLTNCSDLLKEFEDGRSKVLERFQKFTNYYPDVSLMEQHMQSLLSKGRKIDFLIINTNRLYERIDTFFKIGPKKCKNLIEKIKENILEMFLFNARTEQTASLEEWEEEMNSITKGKPSIKVENFIDLERAPQEFLYIDDYLPGSGVIIPEEPPIGCECSVCDSKSKCCFTMHDGCFPYTSACRIRVPPGTPIYECNKRCHCSDSCQNRVVQRGSDMKLCVFRTSNGRGWGVKTLRVIKKGSFVIQYVGEVITSEEAEKRGKEYDAAGRTYLFDLDYNETEGQCPFTVDAAVYGNISHFINHSCDPNLAVYAVWINCLDPNLPKLALFATRDIKQHEEITFDYMCQSTKDDFLRQRLDLPGELINNKSLQTRTRCKCGANLCRQYLF
ncbi:histone-lysine N-methyltransferase SUV39H2 [Copidosoma floridanum]|uniref:histone-lysine N-methyltransferase SUV39H2 n=1 Tax=Copidosoma floridanum TaxID=29053 RepID=UPI0006C976D9|nr:histone-lysine N-methyltransferase SUV39H2 [Copidosoma floridanum]